MAIQKPYNINLSGGIVIPAEEAFTITWSVSGAIQTSYALEIRKNSDSALVYSVAKTSSYSNNCLLPPGTVPNGDEYKITITVWDEADNSATSDSEIFQTSSRPTVTLSPLVTVTNPSCCFFAAYSQPENIPLRHWSAYLYNSSQNLLSQTGLQALLPIEYLVCNLQSEQTYYIEFQVTSEKGLVNTTGKIAFDVRYTTPKLSTGLVGANHDNAAMRLIWNAIQIIGLGENYSYSDDEKVDLTGGKVWFDTGFNVEKNFTLKLWLESVTNQFINITPAASIIASASPPADTSALWLEDINRTTPTTLGLVQGNSAPLIDNLWLVAGTTSGVQLGVSIDYLAPAAYNVVWVTMEADIDSIELLKLNGSNGTISLRYFNGAFHLYRENTLVDSVLASGNAYYLYIRQIDDTLSLGA